MKRCIHACLAAAILACGLFGGPSDADAHGTAFNLLQESGLVAVQFHYSDGEPMAYAEVLVFSPQDPKVEHQNGRTDKHGKFAFCPDAEGAWRMSADDGMGHLCQATVKVGQGAAAGKADKSRQETDVQTHMGGSRTLKIIAGLSLIVNLAFAVSFLRRRSNTRKAE